LLPLLQGKTACRSYIGAAYEDTQRSIRDSRFKLIEYNVRGEKLSRLFDLQNDPWETVDLSGNVSCLADLASLRRELVQWQKQVGDSAEGTKRAYPGWWRWH
jgi:arylsulfatase A-like enzyme